MEERKKGGTREWGRMRESVCVWSGEECVCGREGGGWEEEEEQEEEEEGERKE